MKSFFRLQARLRLRTAVVTRLPASRSIPVPQVSSPTLHAQDTYTQAQHRLSTTASLLSSTSFTSSQPPPPPPPPSANPQSTSSSANPSHSASLTQQQQEPQLPFQFDTGVALFAKRSPRPFPPPFMSPPSGSFSDPLSTHHQSRDRRLLINGKYIKGSTNGDDAVYAGRHFICANDGVGAWSSRPRGHAGLWSRLLLHYWVSAVEERVLAMSTLDRLQPLTDPASLQTQNSHPDPVSDLDRAFTQTLEALSAPNDWQGTTTASGAQIHFRHTNDAKQGKAGQKPVVYVTNLGDCQVMIIRPRTRQVVYKTTEQWHWFDCPRQLGTNSPDTPRGNAVVDTVDVECGDVVLAMSDGVIDNLWEHEIVETVVKSIERWEAGEGDHHHRRHQQQHHNNNNNNRNTRELEDISAADDDRAGGRNGGMKFAATELMEAARKIALDPFAESPYMEHAIEEGLASEGGKPDDISVVAALCVKNEA